MQLGGGLVVGVVALSLAPTWSAARGGRWRGRAARFDAISREEGGLGLMFGYIQYFVLLDVLLADKSQHIVYNTSIPYEAHRVHILP